MRIVIIRALCLSIQMGLWTCAWPATAAAQAPVARPGTSTNENAGGSASPGPGAVTKTATEEDVLIHHGVELRRAHDDLAARAEFQKAYDLTHSPRAAAQIGLAEFALGRFDDAEAHISEALRAARDPWINKYRKELDQSLAQVQTHVARVEVIGEPPGAEVYVNGRLAGRLPLANPVSVSEGQVDVELRAPGFIRASRTLTLSGHQYQRLVIRLEHDHPPGTPTAATGGGGHTWTKEKSVTPGGAPTPGANAGWRVVKWTSLGLAGATLATGIAAAVIANNNTATFEGLHNGHCKDNGGTAYDELTGMKAPDCQPSLDAYRSARTWELVGFIGAGVFATTWLVLTLTEPPETSTTLATRSSSLTPWSCAPSLSGERGATCAFRF